MTLASITALKILVGDPDDLLHEPDAASDCRETTRAWQLRRAAGTAPPFIRIGKKVYYRRGDLRAHWLGARS